MTHTLTATSYGFKLVLTYSHGTVRRLRFATLEEAEAKLAEAKELAPYYIY
jgi:hypothetical protein